MAGKKIIRQSVIIKAYPHDIYEALMDSKKHAEFTGDNAIISRKIGGQFSTFDGYAEGVNLELIPDKKIVQTWRASDWPEGKYSKLTVSLNEITDGTRLTLTQSDIPDGFVEDVSLGWRDYYWQPMKEMLEK